MKKKIVIVVLFFLFFYQAPVEATEIEGPNVIINEGDIQVSFQFELGSDNLKEIRDGISKEMIFHIGLFRSWSIWPDEYITGKKITRTIIADPVKNEFKATSFDGSTLLERRFSSFDSMLNWALGIKNITFLHNHLPEEGTYFIRVTIESRKRTLPKVIGYVFFFVNDREFKITKDSKTFGSGKE